MRGVIVGFGKPQGVFVSYQYETKGVERKGIKKIDIKLGSTKHFSLIC